jgi:CRP-like cAMP-binding protein
LALIRNQLIDGLPRSDRKRLLFICEKVDLILSDILFESGIPAQHVYFPTGGFISLVTPVDGKPALEVGMVGAEGMLGTQVVLGVSTTPLKALVQGPGSAWRAPVADFRRELKRSPTLARNLHVYIHVCMLQLASMAACLRYHEIGPRLARWLLMMHDRSNADTFYVTQEFLAYMLGVRRVGITGAAATLQRRGLISYRRGEILVLDRSGLEAAACSCYASEQKSYVTFLH